MQKTTMRHATSLEMARRSDHARHLLAQRLLVGAPQRVDDVAAAEEEEGRHRLDAQLASEARQLIDVHLDEDRRLGVLVCERLKRGRDALARTAPCRRKVCGLAGAGWLVNTHSK